MCNNCAKEVNIPASELQYFPFKMKNWHCIVDGCKGCINVRDYGMAPFYWDKVKFRVTKNGGWRGSWFNAATHYYMCSRHSKLSETISTELDQEFIVMGEEHMAERFLGKITDR